MAELEMISLSGAASPRRHKASGKPLATALLVAALLAALAVLAIAAVGWAASSHSLGYFTRDPAAITHEAPYMGMVSFFGLFGWAASATALVFGGYIATLRGAYERRTALFLAAAAVIYLLFDDAFQFHEYAFPRYFHLPDSVVQGAYVAVTLAAVFKGRRFLATTNFRLLVAAGIFFAISVGLDVLVASERVIALEDGAKLVGIFTLAAYCFVTALEESGQTFATSNPATFERGVGSSPRESGRGASPGSY